MGKRVFLLVVAMTFFSLTFVCPINSGISSPIKSNQHTAHVAGAQPARNVLHNEIIPLSSLGSGNDMLQFRAGGHVLGFQPDKVYLAGLDHALSGEFLGTKGVMPRAAAAESATKATPALQKVTYADLWPAISVVYETARDGITESTYHLAAGADVSKIRLRYNVPVFKQKDGSLRFSFASGFVTESAPVAWQEIDGRRVPVEASFKVSGNEVGFSVARYDARFPLIIDPIYQWNTFYGSSTEDRGNGIAVDGSGNVYVTGLGDATWGSPLNAYTGGRDIFVLKLNSSGARQWHTFYGSSTYDTGNGIAVDGSGNVYVTGYSDATWGSPKHAHSGNLDIFVLKLNSSGVLQWNTFYGSSYGEGQGIAVDGSGNVYVTGLGDAKWGSPIHAYTGDRDIFVLKLNSNGALQWNTFYGSSSFDIGYGIAVDGSGNVYVTGYSDATWGSPLNAYTGYSDIFVLKLNGSGAFQWNTFHGSSTDDRGYGIAVDGSGNVYVTGTSDATWGTPLNDYTGGWDIIVSKMASSTPLPGGRQSFTYPPVVSPALSETLAGDMPIGVGSAANGGDTLSIRIETDEFSSPVDMYMLFYFPEISPDIYSWTGSSFEPYSFSGLVLWKQSVTGPVDESLFGDFSLAGLGFPQGMYHLGLLVTPAGVNDLSVYYLWVTDFTGSQPAP